MKKLIMVLFVGLFLLSGLSSTSAEIQHKVYPEKYNGQELIMFKQGPAEYNGQELKSMWQPEEYNGQDLIMFDNK